ncbi:MAG: SurA N-terminal domain-containing protein [Candidatus Aminicenantes bacterium]|nr:SurA N-terminal domain-containing protein [Candidatus Aminicenantes bacterium]
MRITKLLIVISLIFMSGAFLFSQEIVEAIVAIVNDDVITLSDYKREHDNLYRMLRSQLQGEKFTQQYDLAKKELLNSMITNLLLSQEAKKMGLDVGEQVKTTIENIKRENNLATDEQLQRALAQQGMDFESFKNEMEQQFLRQNIIFSEVGRKIAIDDSKIVAYYKQHQEEFIDPVEFTLKAIYFAEEGKSEDELENKKQEIDNRINSGDDFGQLSSEYSEGPEKDSQGDLGSFKKGELEKGLEEAVDVLAAGEISPWLNIREGWWRLKLVERKEKRLKAFEEVRKEIEEKLFSEAQEKELDKYLEDLKKRSYIKILIPNPLEM